MYPDQNQPPQQNNYDFIMNPEKPKHSFGGNFFDGSPKSLAIMVGAGLTIILICFVAFKALQPKGLTARLIELNTSQAELTRVAGLISINENHASQPTLNLAATTTATLQSEQSQLTALLASDGVEVSSEELQAAHDPSVDEKLDMAQQAGNFDSEYTSVLANQLKEYQTDLSAIYKEASSETLKSQFSSNYEDIGLILKHIDDK